MRGYMNSDKAIRRAAAEQASKDARQLPKAHTRREKSNTEKNAEYHLQGYGLYFCLHDKSYYEVCPACKRTRREALRNLSSL